MNEADARAFLRECGEYRRCSAEIRRSTEKLQELENRMYNVHALSYDRCVTPGSSAFDLNALIERKDQLQEKIKSCRRKQKKIETMIASVPVTSDIPLFWNVYILGKGIRQTAYETDMEERALVRRLRSDVMRIQS